jgi:hypothetical protein
MDHQDRIYFKGLAFLYGQEEVPFQEYRTHLVPNSYNITEAGAEQYRL